MHSHDITDACSPYWHSDFRAVVATASRCRTDDASCYGATTRSRKCAIVPGPIETALFGRFPDEFRQGVEGFIPQGRLGESDEVAALAAFLLSDEAPFMTGGAYPIDGGELA